MTAVAEVTLADSLAKFRQVYSDCVFVFENEEQWERDSLDAESVRDLDWTGERLQLNDATILYASIIEGYNAFEPGMLAELNAAFRDAGIEVTPSRSGSVQAFFHVPANVRAKVKHFIAANFSADEIEDTEDGFRVWWD